MNDAKSVADLMTLTVPIMKAYMKEAGLDLKGNKAVLVDRLWKHLDKEEVPVADDEEGRLLKFPEVSKYKLADKFKTHLYSVCRARTLAGDDDVQALCRDVHNAADHWAGDHSVCREIDPLRKYVQKSWSADKSYYPKDGPTHVAVKDWLVKKCSLAKMKFFTRARENYMSETFNSVINKYAPKRIHYAKSHISRVACAGLDWNESMGRELLRKVERRPAGKAIRSRGGNRNVLSAKTTN